MDDEIRYMCKYCDRCFQFKDVFDNHRPVCEYFHQTKSNRLQESFETIPSPQEMFRMIQQLTKKCNQLEEEVAKLKVSSNIRSRNIIRQYLQRLPRPGKTFPAWYKNIPVSQDHLQEVFQPCKLLMDGMKECIQTAILLDGISNCPIRCFKEKQGTLYIYTQVDEETDPSWKICCHDQWNRFLDILSHAFMKAFCEWEDDNEELIQSSSEQKDNHVRYMTKLSGSHAFKDKHRQELRIWFHQTFSQSIY
jgi:hypothetical protein